MKYSEQKAIEELTKLPSVDKDSGYAPDDELTDEDLEVQSSSDLEKSIRASMPALHQACEDNDLQKVTQLILDGADVNAKDSYGNSALHIASFQGYKNIAEILLAHKANIEDRNNDNETALQVACTNGKTQVMQYLIDNKADLKVKYNNGNSLLKEALSAEGHGYVAQLLITNAVDINERNKDGDNLLQAAYKESRFDVIKLLEKNGMNINNKNKDYETMLAKARESLKPTHIKKPQETANAIKTPADELLIPISTYN